MGDLEAMTKRTQHSVHPIPGKECWGRGGGSLCVFTQFHSFKAGSAKAAWSVHERVMPAVGRKSN